MVLLLLLLFYLPIGAGAVCNTRCWPMLAGWLAAFQRLAAVLLHHHSPTFVLLKQAAKQLFELLAGCTCQALRG